MLSLVVYICVLGFKANMSYNVSARLNKSSACLVRVFGVNQLCDVFMCLEWTNCEMCLCVWSEPIVKCVCVFEVNQLWDVFVCLEWTMMCPCVFNRTIIWGTFFSFLPVLHFYCTIKIIVTDHTWVLWFEWYQSFIYSNVSTTLMVGHSAGPCWPK